MKKFLLCVLSCMLMTVVLTGCSACNSCKDFFKKDYTVSFLVEDEVFSSQKVKNGKTVTAPESPEKDGYVFKGWYTDETYTTAYDFSSPIKGKTNIYAWLNALYDVSFVADGETLSTQVVENGSRATVPSTPEKANYTFKGWYSDNAFTTAFDFSAPITADTTVYAWLNALYEVSFVVDGETTST